MQFVTVCGLKVKIENPVGSTRSGIDENGKPWAVTMSHAYGEIVGTSGKDGDPVDCFIGPDKAAKFVHVIHQTDKQGRDWDEDKCMLQFQDAMAAKEAYFKNFDSPNHFYGSISTMTIPEFKQRLKDQKGSMLFSSTFKVGDAVTVDGFHGRGVVTKVKGTRANVHFRGGLNISRDFIYLHNLADREPSMFPTSVRAGGPGSGRHKINWDNKKIFKGYKVSVKRKDLKYANVQLKKLYHPGEDNPWNGLHFPIKLGSKEAEETNVFSKKKIDSYKQDIEQGNKLAPLYVVPDGTGKLLIYDGNHRALALMQEKVKQVRVGYQQSDFWKLQRVGVVGAQEYNKKLAKKYRYLKAATEDVERETPPYPGQGNKKIVKYGTQFCVVGEGVDKNQGCYPSREMAEAVQRGESFIEPNLPKNLFAADEWWRGSVRNAKWVTSGKNDFAKNKSDDVQWITIHGQHIPIRPDKYVSDELDRHFSKIERRDKRSKQSKLDVLPKRDLAKELDKHRPRIARIAQKVFNHRGNDTEGLCTKIASRISGYLRGKVKDAKVSTTSDPNDDHFWVSIVTKSNQRFMVDIPYGLYEKLVPRSEGEFQFRDGYKFKANDVRIASIKENQSPWQVISHYPKKFKGMADLQAGGPGSGRKKQALKEYQRVYQLAKQAGMQHKDAHKEATNAYVEKLQRMYAGGPGSGRHKLVWTCENCGTGMYQKDINNNRGVTHCKECGEPKPTLDKGLNKWKSEDQERKAAAKDPKQQKLPVKANVIGPPMPNLQQKNPFKISEKGRTKPAPSSMNKVGKIGTHMPNQPPKHGNGPGTHMPNVNANQGEPLAGADTWGHIEPMTWFSPPSLAKRGKGQKVPVDDPMEKDNKFGDVEKRNSKDTHEQRMKLLKRSKPGGIPPLVPVRTTAVATPSIYGAMDRHNRRRRQAGGGMFRALNAARI